MNASRGSRSTNAFARSQSSGDGSISGIFTILVAKQIDDRRKPSVDRHHQLTDSTEVVADLHELVRRRLAFSTPH
jgi:hypothetical protein